MQVSLNHFMKDFLVLLLHAGNAISPYETIGGYHCDLS